MNADPPAGAGRWGSDLVVETLDALGIDFVALNPGASFRGVHDSLAHARRPELVMTLFEGVAVAVAHGYAKAAGRPMAVALHDLVGLQHGAMALFNAFADQVPMLVIGGSGPADTARRRPWIDWIHSAATQGQFIRELVKWDDEPASIHAVVPSLQRAHLLATAAPCGPTYVALDALLQEADIDAASHAGGHLRAPGRLGPDPGAVAEAGRLLARAARPLIVADLTGRTRAGFQALGQLVERTGARVVDLGSAFNFPNNHPADGTEQHGALLGETDLVLAVDVRDHQLALGSMRHDSHGWRPLVDDDATVISIGLNALLHRGFLDREGSAPIDLEIVAESSLALPALVDAVDRNLGSGLANAPWRYSSEPPFGSGALRDPAGSSLGRLAVAAWDAVRGGPWLLANGDLHGWVRRTWTLSDFGCYLGHSGGGGLGYGPGAAIGAALARRDDEALVVSFQSDGDLFYNASAMWTAAHHRLPVLWIVANNRTYGQDRMHQALMAANRNRSHDVAIGIDIDDPAIDVAGLARAQGIEAWGPVDTHDPGRLSETLARAARVVRTERRPALVDVLIDYEGGRS